MTIEKLARFIVDEDFDGSPADESYQIAVEQEVKKLKKLHYKVPGTEWNYVEVEVTD